MEQEGSLAMEPLRRQGQGALIPRITNRRRGAGRCSAPVSGRAENLIDAAARQPTPSTNARGVETLEATSLSQVRLVFPFLHLPAMRFSKAIH